MNDPLILVINPGSMTTKVALFKGAEEIAAQELEHTAEQLSHCPTLIDQLPLRKEAILGFMKSHETHGPIGAIACRGAPLKPLEGGTYRVNSLMVSDIQEGRLQSPHVSMLAALIGGELAEEKKIPAFIVDPISVDEYMPIAHVSGLPEVPRKSLWHALNSRAVARRFAREHGKEFDALNLLVAHMGSGITVVCLEKGKAIDSTNANSEAPFSPERAGILPTLEFAALCYDGSLPKEKMIKKLTRESGLKAHLGTNDALAVEEMIAAHDEKARIVYEAMAYGVCKTLGALATAVRGRVDAILLTGSLARSSMLTGWIRERVSFIAPVHVYPGQEEMKSLALSVSEVLRERNKKKHIDE